MAMGQQVLVIVPAFNEAEAVGGVIAGIRAVDSTYDVVVVDDGSHDATVAVARAAGATVLALPFNLGVGGAMRVGYRFARDNGYDVAVQVDGDGQHDPTEIPGLVDALADADIVIGARFAGKGDYLVKGPRRVAMRMLARELSRTCRTSLTDATSGFRAVNRRTIGLFAEHYPSEYLGDTVESLVMAARAGLQVRQRPVAMRPRTTGAPSQSPLRAALYLGRAVMVLTLDRVRRLPTLPT
jgi:glycosyltransferase involved in cell wall biosynthesis